MSVITVSTYRPSAAGLRSPGRVPSPLTPTTTTTMAPPTSSAANHLTSAPVDANQNPNHMVGAGQTSAGSTRTFFTLVEPGINSAISRGLFRQVRFLVQFGADVNERDTSGRTPLVHCALVASDPWAVGLARVLVEKGASVGKRDRSGLNALHYACIYNRPELVDVYLGAGDFNLNQGDKLGNTALHYAVSVGNVAIVQKLIRALQRYQLSLDVVNKKGATPLAQAYKCGKTDCAALIIAANAASAAAAAAAEAEKQRIAESVLIDATKAVSEAPSSIAETDSGETCAMTGSSVPPPAAVSPLSPSLLITPPSVTAAALTDNLRTAHDVRNQKLAALDVQKSGIPSVTSQKSSVSSRPATARLRVLVHTPAAAITSAGSTHHQKAPVPSSLGSKSSRPMSAKVMAITQRLTQTPATNRAKSAHRRRGSGDKENEEVDPETALLNQPNKPDRMYRAASATELRNRPDVVFNINPIECLMSGAATHPQISRQVSHSPAPKSVAVPTHPPTSWRCQMGKLYGAFEFQFTPAFVPGVKPLPPEPEPSTEDGTDSSMRPSSAQATESMSESMSDIASICSKGSRRRQSNTMIAEGKGRKGLQNKKRQLQALLTLRGDSDTSSTGDASSTISGHSSTGSSRRRKESSASDGDSGSTSGSGKKPKGRLGALLEPITAVKGLTGKGSSNS